MNVLVACEESQTVCKAFRERGHRAFSCDLQECSGGHPEWHIQGDVLPLLNGNCTFQTADTHTHTQAGRWDLIIAHPPCTHLAVSGAAWFEAKRADGRQAEAIEFFCTFLRADCERIVVENPMCIISGDYVSDNFPALAKRYGLPRKPTQIIQPWQFGDNFSKTTCLWEKGVRPLVPLVAEQPELEWFEWIESKTGKTLRQPKWYADAWRLPPEERARVRSKTFPGIAAAMADQWGGSYKPLGQISLFDAPVETFSVN